MAWKINKISIENFKCFLDKFDSIEPKGKHVLIYGENGSGKSSIYWAVYTHFQSCLKNPTKSDAGKYFDNNHTENLRNIYSQDEMTSGIVIDFVNENGVIKTYTDASNLINTSDDGFMKETTFSSDFMNYKFLSKIFDFKNSKPVDLFDIFVDEIFPFVTFKQSCFDLDGTEMNESTSADFWWKYIFRCYDEPGMLHKRSAKTNAAYVHDEKWHTYQNLLKDFNKNIKVLLFEIQESANKHISEFELPLKIKLELKEVSFDHKIIGTKRSYDGKLTKPSIILTIQIDDRIDIKHPRSFFNEAKLTCVALALRLAVFDKKYKSEECARVIFVDDLLISLDMSNRMFVIRKLLEYAKDYQLFIFTHDYAFYDIVKDYLDSNQTKNTWEFYELYSINDDLTTSNIPEPYVKKGIDYINQAKILYSRCNYHSSATCLRKECEKQLQRLYPKNWIYKINDDGTSQLKSLNNLEQKWNDFKSRYNLQDNPIPNLGQYRKRILNPASHNDNQSVIYKSELKLGIEEISRFSSIQKKCISTISDIGVKQFVLAISYNSCTIEVVFHSNEEWNMIQYNGITYCENIRIDILSLSGMKSDVKDQLIFSIYNKACKELGMNKEDVPTITTCIYDMESHTRIIDL